MSSAMMPGQAESQMSVFGRLLRLADELAENVTDPAAIDQAAARQLIRPLRRADLAELVAGYLVEVARSVVHAQTRELERAAEGRATQQCREAAEEQRRAELYRGRYRHGSMNKRDGAVLAGCGCDRCVRVREEEERFLFERGRRLDALIEVYAAELRAEWTEELFAASFAIDTSGATVTWGEATIDQHERRIAMLAANASANIEAAARHRSAVNELRSTGAANLAELAARPGLDEWVQGALDAAVEQGFSVAIEDPATLDFLADVFAHPGAKTATND